MDELENVTQDLIDAVDTFVVNANQAIEDSKTHDDNGSDGGNGSDENDSDYSDDRDSDGEYNYDDDSDYSDDGGSSDDSDDESEKPSETIKAQIASFDPKTIAKATIFGLTAYALYDVATSGSLPKQKK
ncbi:MAG: hypothetical protein WEA58_03945 [Balneolaceae bacterium]